MRDSSYTYLLIDLCCIIIPLLASFHPKSTFYKHWKYFLPANIAVAIFFLVWDAIFTQMGIWGFNDKYLTGIHVYNLPLEEILFFICIPYSCTYTYFVFSEHVNINFKALSRNISIILAIGAIIVAATLYKHLYTSITFSLLSLLLTYLVIKKTEYLDRFFVVYLIILVPFFISNGLLTGSWLEEPIVWYNDNHNLGIRMMTIPLDDAFYAMLLLLMNIAGYEWLKNRSRVSVQSR